MAKIDAKYLKGLKYQGTEEKEITDAGVKKKRRFPTTRPLEAGDVLDWKDYGDVVVIVAKDGQRHRVSKEKEK